MLGNGVIGILSESSNIWERRAPLTPAHCARLLHSGKGKNGIQKIIVQPSTKRIYHDVQYEDVGCEVSDDLSECGLILGVKQPKLEMILPDRAYAFFSHTHKAQKENMPLDTLCDYELIVGDNGKRLLAFGKFAGRAGLIDFLHGLGKRYLSLGYSTPFLTLGASHMYPSLAAAKAAVISVGEEIAAQGLPPGLAPIVFVFVGSGNERYKSFASGSFKSALQIFFPFTFRLSRDRFLPFVPDRTQDPDRDISKLAASITPLMEVCALLLPIQATLVIQISGDSSSRLSLVPLPDLRRE
ncbi:Alpha-aminoadipic semialdehyde synthase [Platanthera guangdongensis]|uniref:Alpha-aminoadipic semialdehyde synthase n=1 Tax=Platanthera guangdongensis TaxID=2320717 RepID=A0ABR2MQF0_9ASPA